MIQALQKRLRKEDEGFTLIELMVVVLIIAILVAIAIPTFLGARERAQDRAAQSDLRNSLLAAEVHYTDAEAYSATEAELEAIEPELDFVASTAVGIDTTVVGFVDDADTFHAVRYSASGTYFAIRKEETTGTTYCSGTVLADIQDLADACAGDSW